MNFDYELHSTGLDSIYLQFFYIFSDEFQDDVDKTKNQQTANFRIEIRIIKIRTGCELLLFLQEPHI